MYSCKYSIVAASIAENTPINFPQTINLQHTSLNL
jgi:hypothetical protein